MVSVTLITADIRLCWTGSRGASRLFSGVDELNLTDKSRKHFRLSRSCQKNSWTADAETISHWRNVIHTSKTFITCSRQEGKRKRIKVNWWGAEAAVSLPSVIRLSWTCCFSFHKGTAPSNIFVENFLSGKHPLTSVKSRKIIFQMLKAEPELLFYHDPPSDEMLILLNFYSRQSNNRTVMAQTLLKRFCWNKENDLRPQKKMILLSCCFSKK